MSELPAVRPLAICPSVLTADFGHLADAVAAAEEAGADRLHLDVMDGHFVPNITFGPVVVASLRRVSRLPFDVHLMIEDAEAYVDAFQEAGADRLFVHIEATEHLHRLVQRIRSAGASPAVALNPATPIIDLEEIVPVVDSVLVMSVNPGFGGQSFIETTPRKIFRTRRLLDRWNPSCSLAVDGGIEVETAGRAVEAGADTLVAGSSVFNEQGSPAENIERLRAAATEARTPDG